MLDPVAKSGRRKVVIKTGVGNGTKTQVVGGLKQGDKVLPLTSLRSRFRVPDAGNRPNRAGRTQPGTGQAEQKPAPGTGTWNVEPQAS